MTETQNRKDFLTAKQHETTRNKSKNFFVLFRVISWFNLFPLSATLFSFAFLAAENSFAQTKKPTPKPVAVSNPPKVAQIDAEKLKTILKPNGKPLLVNFWATWCEPCREEFPDLVKIAADYKDRVDVITVSLDDLAEINGDVPKFLAQMKSEQIPAYLLKTPDESQAVSSVSANWQGALPFTILYNAGGETVYTKQGKFNTAFLRAEIEKSLARENKPSGELVTVADFVKIKDGKRDEAIFYYENNWKIYREIALKKGYIHSYELLETKAEQGADFDLILITRYADEKRFQDSEKNFEPILKEARPNGALLKNDLKPEDFRQNVFVKIGKIAISSNR